MPHPKPPEPGAGLWWPLHGLGKDRAQSHLWVILALTGGPPELQQTLQRAPLFPAASPVPLKEGETVNGGVPHMDPQPWGEPEEGERRTFSCPS